MPRTMSKEEDIQRMVKDFVKDMKHLFGNSVAARKNLKRARRQVWHLFNVKHADRIEK